VLKIRRTKSPIAIGWLTVATTALVAGCASHPRPVVQPREIAAAPANQGAVAGFAEQLTAIFDGQESAFRLVASSTDALASRLALLDSAEVSLDIQYFIWQGDATGYLLLDRLIAAADRGVRVRLLIDDVSVFKRDREHVALAMHPRIEMKTFNPWRSRSRVTRGLEFLFRFRALNHRLHNKTTIADGRLAMVGGRNIGDRYFGVYDVFVQNDLDILLAGSVVEATVENFDEFWNSPLSVPVASYLRPRRNGLTLEELRQKVAIELDRSGPSLESFPVDQTDWTSWFAAQRETFLAGRAALIADAAELPGSPPRLLTADLLAYLATTRREVVLSTAYFIPDDALFETLASIVARGARVVLLTNSLKSNNHMLAHVAYRRWRRDLLRAGVELYELKPDGPLLEAYGVHPVEPGFMGLHSKAAVVDGRWAFVGTPNLDPRSLELNMESGVIADSTELAAELRALILEAANEHNAWRVELDERGRLEWTSADGTLKRQPANGLGQRIMEFLYTFLPIKNQA
jgi:putative cardiolipin synthase